MNAPRCSLDLCQQGNRKCPCPQACETAIDDEIADLYDWRVLVAIFAAIAVLGVAIFA